jgi:two-component system, NarL family, response regulator NreC
MNDDTNPITVIIADDHELLLDGFHNLFKKEDQIQVVASALNGYELVTAVKNYLPQVVLTDIRMPVLDGVEATRSIKSRYPHIKVIAFTAFDEYFLISDMMAVKADGYLLKNVHKSVIIEAIKTVVSGKPYYCHEVSEKVQTLLDEKEQKPVKNIAFTERELEVMIQIAQAKESKCIARELSISTRTVETYRHSLYKKIGVNGVVGVALYAQRHGYLK